MKLSTSGCWTEYAWLTADQVYKLYIPYSRKLLWIGEKYDFCRESFCRLLVFAVPKDGTPPNFVETTFANSHKTTKLFSLESFRLYGTCISFSLLLSLPLPHQTHLCLCQEVSLSTIVRVLVQPELHQHLLTTRQSHDIHARHITFTWHSHYIHMTVTWHSHNSHMIFTWESHDNHTASFPRFCHLQYLKKIYDCSVSVPSLWVHVWLLSWHFFEHAMHM